MKTTFLAFRVRVLGCLLAAPLAMNAASGDLYIKDAPGDDGSEPNAGADPTWVSPDIWIRRQPIKGYQPYPFDNDPKWLTEAVRQHQNPEYRDPKLSRPNYLYVRVRNRGTADSPGTERLRVYWAKAATALSWPGHFEDSLEAHCGSRRLLGIEITKPRRNIADANVADAAVNAYGNAVRLIGTGPQFKFASSDTDFFFDKQDEVHEWIAGPKSKYAAHRATTFTPWHRELINRYENLLREADPTVTLFYWDWTTNPKNVARIAALTGKFDGAIGPPLDVLAPPAVKRFLGTTVGREAPTTVGDLLITSQTSYAKMRNRLEEGAHDHSHGFLGGPGGNMSALETAAEDPIFFLLHGNVDRLWSSWQRQKASRLDPAQAYGTTPKSLDPKKSGNPDEFLPPWNGIGEILPWQEAKPGTDTGGQVVHKTSRDPSVVYPPIYDTAPLVVPVLKPNQSVVIQIPWYPPNLPRETCEEADLGHVAVLARIETAATAPFGMTKAEEANLELNTRRNNNIAVKNVSTLGPAPGRLLKAPTFLRSFPPDKDGRFRLDITTASVPAGANLLDYGTLRLDLTEELYTRWTEATNTARRSDGVEHTSQLIKITGTPAFIEGILVRAMELNRPEIQFELKKPYDHPQEKIFTVDVAQKDANGVLLGGHRFVIDFNRLTLVAAGAKWRYFDTGVAPPTTAESDWRKDNFDDSAWREGAAPLGFGGTPDLSPDNPATTLSGGPPNARHISTWFRHKFLIEDKDLYTKLRLRLRTDDGAVVYLNGEEIHRVNLPVGEILTGTLATKAVEGDAEAMFLPTDVSAHRPKLRNGANVLAVEVHQVTKDSDDLTLDLELAGNPGAEGEGPQTRLMTPADPSFHLVGRPVTVIAEAYDPDANGAITSVALFAGDTLLASHLAPVISNSIAIYPFVWNDPPAGEHQITVIATDQEGLSAQAFASVSVVSNLPPQVRLTHPIDGAVLGYGESIAVEVEASDDGGEVVQVDYFLQWGGHFASDAQRVDSSTFPPFGIELSNLPPGHYLLTALATDNQGEPTPSLPVMFEVVSQLTRTTLVARGSSWRYQDLGSDEGEAWRGVGFPDFSWAEGPAPLGYGNGNEATQVRFGPDGQNKYITTYFRSQFYFDGPTWLTHIELRLMRDDGAIVYLNGTELVRDNLPEGPLSYLSRATTSVQGAEETNFVVIVLPVAGLVVGDNVLAVEVHQDAPDSSDLRFDLELVGLAGCPAAPPRLGITHSGGEVFIFWDSPPHCYTLQSSSSVIGPWEDVESGMATFYQVPADHHSGFFRLVLR